MLRRTKIVATLGPATDDPKVLDQIIAAGVDVVRLNMSHGTHEEHERRADWVRNRARASGRQVGVLIDLQGPKIRCGKFVVYDGASISGSIETIQSPTKQKLEQDAHEDARGVIKLKTGTR